MRSTVAVSIVAAFVAVGAPRPSSACGNAIQLTQKEVLRVAARAERILDRDDDPQDALRVLSPLYRALKARKPPSDPATDPLAPAIARADLVRATAQVRVGTGRVDGRALLEVRAAAAPEDTLLQARVAEAKSYGDAEDQAAALATLEDLASRDLLPDGHAWAALAWLRRAGGDDAGSDAAVQRCKKLTKIRSTCALGKKTERR